MEFSVTKSYLSTIAGLVYDSRLIKSVDDRVSNYVEEKYEGEHNSKITWRHLLTQSSDWSGCLFDLCDWAAPPPPPPPLPPPPHRTTPPPAPPLPPPHAPLPTTPTSPLHHPRSHSRSVL